MKVLVITSPTLFPSDPLPNAGVFFANLLRELSALVAKVVVVTPTAYVPPLLLKLPMFSAHRGMVYRQCWKGIEVFRPRAISVSRFGTARMLSLIHI